MTTITVALPDDLMTRLKQLAERHRVTPEELVRVSVEELVAEPEDVFQEALEEVLRKNQELYKRLAA
ncbi:MAG: ribbon-helix-helix protein, CopG family [Anaerolineales bacterium]|nr:ribbon-helix-helix protein, CopG family [Anaerolineales bacterium]